MENPACSSSSIDILQLAPKGLLVVVSGFDPISTSTKSYLQSQKALSDLRNNVQERLPIVCLREEKFLRQMVGQAMHYSSNKRAKYTVLTKGYAKWGVIKAPLGEQDHRAKETAKDDLQTAVAPGESGEKRRF